MSGLQTRPTCDHVRRGVAEIGGRSCGRLLREKVFEPCLNGWPDAGVYQLWLRVGSEAAVTVGRLGRFVFSRGVYVYTGRASRGLRARVARHVNGAARKHWHIDYLLADSKVRLTRVVLASPDPEMECPVNQSIAADGECLVPGFGASDCRNGCPAHLWYLPEGRPREASAGPRFANILEGRHGTPKLRLLRSRVVENTLRLRLGAVDRVR